MSPLGVKNGGHVAIHAGSIVLAVITQVISGIFFFLAKDSSVPNVYCVFMYVRYWEKSPFSGLSGAKLCSLTENLYKITEVALFQTSSWNVSETLPLEVTMDWWSQQYWIMIDLWSLAWLLNAVASVFKRNVLGPESCNPEIHPPVFYLTWTMINIARMCSMVLWDRHDVLEAIVIWWILPVLSFYMLYLSYSNLEEYKAALTFINPSLISWTRYLTQNGLAAFAWWSLLNAVVGLGIVFRYKAGMQDPTVSTIALTLVCLCTLTWFILQSFLLNKYLRYTYSVYAILILGLGAMFTRSYHINDLTVNTVYCGFLMLLMTILSAVHLITECLRTDESIKPLAVEPYMTLECCETVCQSAGDLKHKPQK